jgi:hypothetical protein
MDAVVARGDAAVAPLAAALRDGPSATQIANVRAQARSSARAAERVRSRHASALGPGPLGDPIDTTAFFARQVENYVNLYRERGLIGLSAIGTPAARDSIRQLRQRDQAAPYGWTPYIRKQANAHDLGVFGLELAPLGTVNATNTKQAIVTILGPRQNAQLAWTSSAPVVATVNTSGLVTAGPVAGQSLITVCWSELLDPRICAMRVVQVVP